MAINNGTIDLKKRILGIPSNATRGPSPSGFHVPLDTEWTAVYNIWTALGGGGSDGTNFGKNLKIPFAGNRAWNSAAIALQGTSGFYWAANALEANFIYNLRIASTTLNTQNVSSTSIGFSIRCFKDTPVVPDSDWTMMYGTSIESGGIFWNATDGLISLSSDGETWITIADKNLGATQVWNYGDALSEANCGYYYQRGNNYGFPRTGTIANQSTTQVDASSYGPGNYYYSNVFIKTSGRWDTTANLDLRGGITLIIPYTEIERVVIFPDGITEKQIWSKYKTIKFLLVGGGGGSGGCRSISLRDVYGGGGAGGLIHCDGYKLDKNSYNIVIGTGGSMNFDGGNSCFGDIIAYGGGAGGGTGRCCQGAGIAGGSGGGGSSTSTTYYAGGTGCIGQGNNGGRGYRYGGGGGGGAGCPGCDGTQNVGGGGGDGLAYDITGKCCYYAGGGAGRGCSCTQGTSGCGYDYCGGGGKGGQGKCCGECGVFVVSYPASCGDIVSGGDCCYECNGNCIHIFTSNGTLTVN